MKASIMLAGYDSPAVAQEFPKVPSYAITQKEKTALGDALASDIATHPQQSGFRLLMTGSESFSMRLALIEAAEKSLDLQYYSINDDTTSNLLLEALVRAQKRGVLIRFLLDNIMFNQVEETFYMIDGFKNLEIRIFNPFITRHDGIILRAIRVLTDIDRLNHRMHNKALIADNQMAIIGGRNLGDEYFEEDTDVIFRDIDILAAGPVTARISQSFDSYWNGKDAIPVGQLRKPNRNLEKVEIVREKLAEYWEKVMATDKGRKLLQSPLTGHLKDGNVTLIWAKVEFIADDPQKIDKDRENAQSKPLIRLGSLLQKATSEFIAVTPYFVPGNGGVQYLTSLVERGVKVQIVTNSLASTDIVAAHTGYRRYRKALVSHGIELYEMKPTGGKRPRQRLIGISAPSSARLHAKAYVVDKREVMIGSFNLDPRSLALNTELALTIHSPELAAQVIKMLDEITTTESSYHLVVAESGWLVWKATENNHAVEYSREPKVGLWRNMEAVFMGLLPIEDHI
jgi:cardiolipin synthase C